MVNQQKQVQQETAYSTVVVNDHNYYASLSLPISFFHVSMTSFGSKNGDTYYDHSLQQHYRQFLVLLIYHP